MADEKTSPDAWLQVIAKCLAFLCVQEVTKTDPKRVPDVPAKVKFLEEMGLHRNDAAHIMGTTANSVQTNLRNRERKGGKSGKKKTKR